MKLTLSPLKGLLALESEGCDVSASPLNLACPTAPYVSAPSRPAPISIAPPNFS